MKINDKKELTAWKLFLYVCYITVHSKHSTNTYLYQNMFLKANDGTYKDLGEIRWKVVEVLLAVESEGDLSDFSPNQKWHEIILWWGEGTYESSLMHDRHKKYLGPLAFPFWVSSPTKQQT